MIQHIKTILIKGLGAAVLLAVFAGSEALSQGASQMKSGDGLNNALDGSGSMLRDPFWPVGYKPKWVADKETEKTEKQEVNGNIDWKKAMKQVAIQGVSSRSGNEYFTVINGKIKSVGETVIIQNENLTYTWMVDSIAPPRSVKLRRVSVQ